MTVKDTFNSLGDGFRNAYGITDQLTFNQMTTLVNDLVPKTIIELDTAGFTYPSNTNDDKALTGSGRHTPLFSSRTAKQNTDLLNSLFMLGRSTITISYDIEWSGFKPTSDINSVRDRIGYELNVDTVINNSGFNFINCWTYLNKESGKEHRVESYTIDKVQFGEVRSSNFYVQANVDKVKITNFKIVQNPILDATNYALGITNNIPWCSWVSYIDQGYNNADYTISKVAIGETALGSVDVVHSNIDTSITRGIYRLSFWYRSDVERSDNILSFWFSWNDKSSGYQDSLNFLNLKKGWNLHTQDVKYDPDDATLGKTTAWILRTDRKYIDDHRFYPYTLQIRDLRLTKISEL